MGINSLIVVYRFVVSVFLGDQNERCFSAISLSIIKNNVFNEIAVRVTLNGFKC